MRASVALYAGGMLWVITKCLQGLGDLGGHPQPIRPVLASVLILVTTAIAADGLLLDRPRPPRAVALCYMLTPTILAIVASDGSNWYQTWWVAASLSLLATIAARWGLVPALASGMGLMVVTLLQTPDSPGFANNLVDISAALAPVILWPSAATIFRRMLVRQNVATDALRSAQTEASAWRDRQIDALDDLPVRLVEMIGPTLGQLAGDDVLTADLRRQCAALDRRVRDEIRTRRMLDDDGRSRLTALAAVGWQVRFEDDAPPLLGAADLLLVHEVCLLVLDGCRLAEPALVTVRLLGRDDRLLTVMVTGPAATDIATRLHALEQQGDITTCKPFEIDANPEDLVAEIPMASTDSQNRSVSR